MNQMDIKQCCTDFYEQDMIKLFLGPSMHPGGLLLTKELADKLGIGENAAVLDVACGAGASAIFLAKTFGCSVTGVDLGAKNLEEARRNAREAGVSHLVKFAAADAEGLKFKDESFDFVIAECSFCLFPDKRKASAEMYRVLKSEGKIGLSDIVVRGELPEKMKNLFYKLMCISEAQSEAAYQSILEQAGFTHFCAVDKKSEVLTLLVEIRKKILVGKIVQGLGKIDGKINFAQIQDALKTVGDCAEKNILSYALMTADKAG